METILIQVENVEQVRILQSFLTQNNMNGRVLSDDDKEDIVLGRLMEETDTNERIDTNAFLKKLRS